MGLIISKEYGYILNINTEQRKFKTKRYFSVKSDTCLDFYHSYKSKNASIS